MRTRKQLLSNSVSLVVLLISITFLFFLGRNDLTGATEQNTANEISQKVILTEKTETKTSEYYGAKRAQLALQEYHLGVAEESKGCDCGPEIDKYTEGHNAQWCTMFASWIAKEAGSPFINKDTGRWRINNSRDLEKYLKENGTWFTKDEVKQKNLQPKMGDFIIYWRGNYDSGLGHVDIVVNPGKTEGYAETVGGNIRGKVVMRTVPFRDSYGFLGFGRPEKQ